MGTQNFNSSWAFMTKNPVADMADPNTEKGNEVLEICLSC